MKNVIFLYNPTSGEAQISEYLDSIIGAYQKAGYVITTIRISREMGFKPLIPLTQELHNIAHILLAGGDGTVNKLVNFMKNNGIDIPLAILPTGTANDFAKVLDMPNSIMSSVKAIISGQVQRVDLGKAGTKYFVNIFSSGLFTEISQKTPTILKNTFGKVAYYFGSIGELPNFKKVQVTVTSPELSYSGQCLLIMVFNGRSAGNLQLAKLSSATDGMLDVYVMKGHNIAHTIRTLFHFLLQRSGNYPDDVVYFQSSSLRIDVTPNIPTDIDGEPGGDFPLEIECIPQALQVIVPIKKQQKL